MLTKKRNVIIIIVFVLLLITMSMSISKVSAEKHKLPNETDATLKYVENQIISLDLKENYDCGHALPEIYRILCNYLINSDDYEESLSKAKFTYLENSSLSWFAIKEGIAPNDATVEEYINNLIISMKQSENREELENAYASYGTSFSDFVVKDRDTYALMCATNNIYDKCIDDYCHYNDIEKDGLTYEDYDKLSDYWDAFKATILDDYCNSTDFQKVMSDIDYALNILSNVESISDIYSAIG